MMKKVVTLVSAITKRPVSGRTLARPERFFQATQQAWQQAAQTCLPSQHFYRIGGLVVQLQIVGAALATRLTAALAHLALPPTQPQLTILGWDVAATPIRLPPSLWQPADHYQRSELRGFQDGRFLAAYQLESGSFSLLDRQKGLAIYAVQDGSQLPYYEDGMPFRTILHWWLRDQGRQLLHAAAIGNEQGGVLIVGKSGSGKSTTALASLLAGMCYVADDYCCTAIKVADNPQALVYSLYNSGKIAADHLRHFPTLASLVNNTAGVEKGEKALLLLQQHFPTQVVACLPLRAILLPTITGERTTCLQPAGKGEALRALAPSTIFQLSTGGEQDFRFLTQLVEQVPTYRLNLGTDLAQIPKVIQTLLCAR